MPIVNFHLVQGQHSDQAIAMLLEEASHFYVKTMYPGLESPPLDRIRTFVTLVSPDHWATAGTLISAGGETAPYFTCLALADRPIEQLHELMRGFTDLVERHLGCRRMTIRGQVVSIDPARWSIGGEPASAVRGSEAKLRAGA